MKKVIVFTLGILACTLMTYAESADNTQCYGYTSTSTRFPCGTHGNCTWWAAHKRPDLVEAGISGNGGEWYDNARRLGFYVGSNPHVGAIAVFSYGQWGMLPTWKVLEVMDRSMCQRWIGSIVLGLVVV